MIGTRVVSIHDDRDVPEVGEIIAVGPDGEKVTVQWPGEDRPVYSTEYADQLTPARQR